MVYGRDSDSLPLSNELVDPLRRGAWRMGQGCRWWPGGVPGAAAFSASAGAVSEARSTAELVAGSRLGASSTARSIASTSRALGELLAIASGPADIGTDIGLDA